MKSPSLVFAESVRVIILVVAMVLLFIAGVDYLLRLEGIGQTYTAWIGWRAIDQLGPWAYAVFAGLCIILPVIYIVIARIVVRLHHGIIGVGNDGEKYHVRPEAVEPVISKAVRKNVDGIERIHRCTIEQKLSRPHCFVHISVAEDADLPHVQRSVKAEAARVIKRILGVEDARIRVKFTTIVIPDEPRRRKGEPASE